MVALKLLLRAVATAPIPIPTTIIGPSSFAAVMPDSRHLRSGREVSGMINDEELLAQRASLILGIARARGGRDCGKRAKRSSATATNT